MTFRPRITWRRVLIALPLLALAALFGSSPGCSRYSVGLTQGYLYEVENDSGIGGPEFSIHGDVMRFMRLGTFLVGERGIVPDDRFPPDPPEKYGFFIIDMRSHHLTIGLDEPAFRRALAERGLPAEPFARMCGKWWAFIPLRYFCDGFESPTFDRTTGKATTINRR